MFTYLSTCCACLCWIISYFYDYESHKNRVVKNLSVRMSYGIIQY